MSNMLNTRIRLKYDTFENWSKDSAKTLVLLEGELAVVSIPNGNTQEVNSVTAPQILFKVGDGVTQFQYLPWASAKAADVYTWAKQPGLSINKDGTGNVVSGIEWDATANNGKGGIKFTTAAVATSEGLQGVQDRLAALEAEMGDVANDYANSRIDVLEKTISDNQANWAKDDDTTYTFEEIKDENEKVTGIKITPKGGNAQPISFDFITTDALISFLNPEDDYLYLSNVYTDYVTTGGLRFEEGDSHSQELVADYENQTFKIVGETEKTIATVDQIPTELGVMDVDGENAIEVTGDANKIVKLKINSNKGNVTFDNSSDGLRASVDLAALVPGIKVNNAGHADSADNATKLNGQEASHYATAQSVTDAVGRISTLEASVGNLSGAFQFKGEADSVDQLGPATDSNVGFVYVIGDLEYVSDGHNWIQLGDEGSFVLKTTYQAHLETQAEIDKGQSDKIKAIEDDIAANRADWATKTSVTDPAAGDGKITVNGTELTVYDDSALKTRVQNIEDAYISTVNGKTADDNGNITLTGSDINVTVDGDTTSVQETILGFGELFADIFNLFDGEGRALRAATSDELDGHDSDYFATAEGLNDATGRISTLEGKKTVEYYEATEPNLEEEVYVFYCGSSSKLV